MVAQSAGPAFEANKAAKEAAKAAKEAAGAGSSEEQPGRRKRARK